MVLTDSFGRVATDLRVSLTDRCNLRCTYCMPAEGLDWLPRAEQLTDEETVRLVRIAVTRLGITEIRLTGGGADILAGLAAAAAAGLVPVKVNTVLMRGVNDHEAPGLLAFCLARGYQLRFIEQMPLDAQHAWERSRMVTAEEILASLSQDYALTPDSPAARGAAPAETFLVDGGPARVGVIVSVTRPFCGACDRVRLTADGQLRNCLFAQTESDLRTPLRTGATDEEIAERWIRAVAVKLPGHGINEPGFLQPSRPMSAIGG